jgi:glycosyltransferase involved in cell wall biosynthesis
MHNQDEGHQWRYYAYRLTSPLADATTTVSQVALEEAIRRHAAPANGIRVVHNGIDSQKIGPDATLRADTRRALGITDEFTWLSVGRLTEAKRHVDLLAAMRIVSDSLPGGRLLIAGVGPLHSRLESEIERAGLSRTVSLLGLRDDVPALMQAADGFVLSSAWEGLPMVLLEAGASALPIVATDVGGSAETVLPGTTGWLVPPRRPRSLADAMIRVMAVSPEERREMGARSREHIIRYFDMAAIADQWEAIYRQR